MISIAIINLKGGVGKSVTACNLAAELAAKSKSVLVVDLDKQGNTSKFFGVLDYDSPSVAEVMLGEDDILAAIVKGVDVWGVHLLPCDMRMLKANAPAGQKKMLQYDSTLLGVNEPYWAYIMENLQAQGYITGLTVVAAWGGARSISNLERCQITPDGIAYRFENNLLAKEKELLKDVKAMTPFI